MNSPLSSPLIKIKNIIHHLHKGAFVKDDNLLHSSRGAAHLLKLCQYNKIAIG